MTNRRPEIKLTDDERKALLEFRKEAVAKEDQAMELRAAIVLTAERRHADGLIGIARFCGDDRLKRLVSSILNRFVRAPAGKRIDVVRGGTRGRPAGVLKGGNERIEILAEIRQFAENTPGAKVEHYKEFLDEHFDESFAIKTVYRYLEQAGIDLR